MSSSSGAPGAGAAASSSTSSSSLEALEGFALLCKSSSGLQCVMVLKQVLKHPQIFVFGELFQIPSISELEASDHRAWFDLLKLFAYGTYMDYKAQAQAKKLPELGAAESTKLKQLTIVDMAATQRVSPASSSSALRGASCIRVLTSRSVACFSPLAAPPLLPAPVLPRHSLSARAGGSDHRVHQPRPDRGASQPEGRRARGHQRDGKRYRTEGCGPDDRTARNMVSGTCELSHLRSFDFCYRPITDSVPLVSLSTLSG
jgi:hypothetical protein